jgi:hypothetical protein
MWVYARAPDRWPELFKLPEGYCLQLMNNIYGIRQAARAWHMRLSTWMVEHGYLPVNEKTIFMKWDSEDEDFIIHGVFVDDFATIPTKDKFEALYSANFDVTGEVS